MTKQTATAKKNESPEISKEVQELITQMTDMGPTEKIKFLAFKGYSTPENKTGLIRNFLNTHFPREQGWIYQQINNTLNQQAKKKKYDWEPK